MNLLEREILEKLVQAAQRWKERDYVHGDGFNGLCETFDVRLEEAIEFLKDVPAPE